MIDRQSAPLVLVVEDHPDSRDLMAEILELAGCRVELASSGHEALSRATEVRPDLIFMDLSLPGLDGWEVTRQLRTNRTMRKTRIVAVTAYAFTTFLDEARAAGCDAVLTKPVMPEQILEHVRQLVGRVPHTQPDSN